MNDSLQALSRKLDAMEVRPNVCNAHYSGRVQADAATAVESNARPTTATAVEGNREQQATCLHTAWWCPAAGSACAYPWQPLAMPTDAAARHDRLPDLGSRDYGRVAGVESRLTLDECERPVAGH